MVVPVYGSDKILPELASRTEITLKKITPHFELLFVNDASPDNAWQVITKLAHEHAYIRGINLSRNFGQYPAITAGLAASRGEWIVIMDCDLQDRPEEIEKMYTCTKDGYYAVIGSRQKRHDSALRLFVSWGFYGVLSYLTGRRHDRSLANFGIYHRKVIDAVLSLRDHMRYFSVMVRWVGFRTAIVPVEHAERKGGKSGYSFVKLLSLATDILLAYTERPLRAISKIGLGVSVFATIYLCVILATWLTVGEVSSMSLILGTLWLMFGLLTTIIGIVALYLGKTFEETKKRPIYIVQDEI